MSFMQLILNDCKRELKWMKDNSVDSVVTDPPYELKFMGKNWDGSGIAYDVEMWGEVLRILKPGGHLLAFGHTRTHHRMMVAIEDAGFEIRDCLMWMYGTGFPKSHNISKAIDKKADVVGEIIGDYPNDRPQSHGKNEIPVGSAGLGKGTKMRALVTPEAIQWEGWGTALKPAYEPIVLARKPLAEKTIVANVLEYGTGGINIDESRITTSDGKPAYSYPNGAGGLYSHEYQKNSKIAKDWNAFSTKEDNPPVSGDKLGRFPANVLFTHHSECKLIGNKIVKGDGHAPKLSKGNPFGGKNDQKHEERYFNQEVVEDWICHEECPIRILDSQSGILKSGKMDSIAKGGASRFFYCAKASKSERNEGLVDKNTHPTVKPIKLMEYLVKLITPLNGTVLDPFMGSGSTGCACATSGFDFIGIELEEESFNIAKSRITHYENLNIGNIVV